MEPFRCVQRCVRRALLCGYAAVSGPFHGFMGYWLALQAARRQRWADVAPVALTMEIGVQADPIAAGLFGDIQRLVRIGDQGRTTGFGDRAAAFHAAPPNAAR